MHIDDMNAGQRKLAADAARGSAIGGLMAALHPVHWIIGVLGFVLIAIRANQMRALRPGFDRVQRYASLCAACKVVYMALRGTTAAVAVWMALPVLETLLAYALWQAFGRMCADGNKTGRSAICAALLCAGLTVACTGMGHLGLLLPVVYLTAHNMSLGFQTLAAILLAAFLLIKRRKLKEDTR